MEDEEQLPDCSSVVSVMNWRLKKTYDILVVGRGESRCTAALLVRVRVFKAGRLLQLGGLLLLKHHSRDEAKSFRGDVLQKVFLRRAQQHTDGVNVYLTLGEAPDERAAGALAAAGRRLVCRVGAIVAFTLTARKDNSSFSARN